MQNRINLTVLFLLLVLLHLTACVPAPAPESDRIPVVATTSILADVVSRVGGDRLDVTSLVPPGANEHEYQPSPRDIAAVTDAGESVRWEGEIALAPFRSTGKLTLNGIRTASLWQFVRDSVNLEEPEGRIDFATAYRLNAGSSPLQLTLEGLHFSITELALQLPQAEKPLFQAKQLELTAPRFDLASRELQVSRLLLGGGAIDARLDEGGALNLQQVIRPSPPSKTGPTRNPPPAASARPFTVKADVVEIKDIAMTLDDRSRQVPVRAAIAGADLHLQAELAVGGGPTRAVLRRIAGEWRGIRVDRGRSPEPLFAAETLTADLDADFLWEAAGSDEFQINAGLRIYGGYGRYPQFKKHSLRVLFKDIYGASKFDFPLFGDQAVDRFDTLILRSNFNDGWTWGGTQAQYIRDQFADETLLAMMGMDRVRGRRLQAAGATRDRSLGPEVIRGLFAAAAAYRQGGSADHLAFATQLFDWWDSHLHDAKCSGYFETLDRYGSPATRARGPASPGERDCIGTPYGLRSSNTLIHAVEALTEFYLASEGETVRARLEECVKLLERLVTRASRRLYRYFDADWSPVDRARSYGHEVETCFLVARARRALGWAGHSPIRRLGENALSRGYDRRYGGLYSGQRRGWLRRDRAKTWWVQAELLNYLASELAGATPASTRVLQRMRQTWRFIAKCQVDAQYSGWFDTLSRDGTRILRADKGGPWKAIYHEVRALLNAADALRSLDAASGP